tara:strand:- start:17023 stop:17361 length:339 start_codon:yes stop_codon:yes gene_type:complete
MAENIDDIKNLIKIYPKDVLLLTSLGKIYLNEHHNVEAINTFKKVIEINPEYTVAYRFLGKALTAVNNLSGAEEIYIKGIKKAEKMGDLQTKKEIEVFLKRIQKKRKEKSKS